MTKLLLLPAAFAAFSAYKGSAFYVPAFVVITIVLAFYGLWFLLHSFEVRSSSYCYTSHKDVSTPHGTKPVKKTVCVIGAGPSGLCTTKELLAEGHSVTVYEKHAAIGGVFFYDKDKGGAYDSTVLTISNYLMSFSDCPPLADTYRFWHHTDYYKYLLNYVQHFQLEQRASFNYSTSVLEVKKLGSKWVVSSKKGDTGEVVQQTFDAIAVCNGAHQAPNILTFKGQENSPITIAHSTSYKNAATDPRIKGKRVVCMGIGETGADVSAEVAEVASKAWLSVRRTPHVIARNHWNLGYPADVFSTRAMFYPHKAYLEFLHSQDQGLKLLTSGKIGKKIFNGFMGLGNPVTAKIAELASRSGGGVAQQFLTKNDKFIPYLLNGTLEEKTNVASLEGRTVHFVDGTSVDNVDTIMLSTGFVDSFPFLPAEIKILNMRDLYKHAFHPAAGTSIAFIGFARPTTGGVPACAEAVARYWSLILSNQRKLPDNWIQRIAIEKAMEEQQFHLSSRIKTLVFWGEYMESISQHTRCSPHLFKYLFTRPLLWVKLCFGPLVPHHYRLRGPHADTQLAEKVIKEIPMVTPIPFAIAQSVSCVLSFIGGSIAGFRVPNW